MLGVICELLSIKGVIDAALRSNASRALQMLHLTGFVASFSVKYFKPSETLVSRSFSFVFSDKLFRFVCLQNVNEERHCPPEPS